MHLIQNSGKDSGLNKKTNSYSNFIKSMDLLGVKYLYKFKGEPKTQSKTGFTQP